MLGVVVGQCKHSGAVCLRLLFVLLLAGLVGRWWHDISVLYLVSWRWRSFGEVGKIIKYFLYLLDF
jgi:phosphate starvation-inducible membrane PsiE